jgi:2-keto-4-pentenoate hydratase/2-oxohepta-3-ene-1,7-dioic acid hydratase in catechol pathway
MIYWPPKLIKYFSSFTPLSPGNVIVSGMGVGLAAQCRPW